MFIEHYHVSGFVLDAVNIAMKKKKKKTKTKVPSLFYIVPPTDRPLSSFHFFLSWFSPFICHLLHHFFKTFLLSAPSLQSKYEHIK